MKDHERLLGRPVSLSDYFPPGTAYFFSYPNSEDSGFYSVDAPAKAEIEAARALVTAGPHVKIVVFAGAAQEDILKLLSEDLGMKVPSKENLVALPKAIDASVHGEERDKMIKDAFKRMLPPNSLVMAQPFMDEDIAEWYQIPPERTAWINDKDNMPLYVPQEYLAVRQAAFADGTLFAESEQEFTVPCIVKITSSASGDGVRICKEYAQLKKAQKDWKEVDQQIIVEDYVESEKNLAILFGIPEDPQKPPEVIGWNGQVVSDDGDWLGGLVDYTGNTPEIDKLIPILEEEILPKVRDRGWYGLGGMDVLIGKNKKFYFIDPNFRMTGTTPFLFEALKNTQQPMISFYGSFKGSEQEFKEVIVPIAKEGSRGQILKIVALARQGAAYEFNAAMFFKDDESRQTNAQKLLDLGVKAGVLAKLAKG